MKKEVININFSFSAKPESYARERKGRGKHFYNPKGNKMQELRDFCWKTIEKEKQKKLKELFSNENSSFFVELELKFYIPVPKGDSKKTKEMKLNGFIQPTVRPDLDNYVKFVMDSMHEVLYDDDKRVTKISSEKLYGEIPRTDILAILTIIED